MAKIKNLKQNNENIAILFSFKQLNNTNLSKGDEIING